MCRCPIQAEIQLCGDCEELLIKMVALHQNPEQEFSSLWQRFYSLGRYQSPLDRLLLQGKYYQNRWVLRTLAGLFAKSIQTRAYDKSATIIPIPMSQSRYLERGFNQAAVIARVIAKQLAMTYVENAICHTGRAGTQHELNKVARKRNMKKAFEVLKPVPKRVCVVDDIYTTGATIQAMCQTLRRAGCEYIEIWIIAKTL